MITQRGRCTQRVAYFISLIEEKSEGHLRVGSRGDGGRFFIEKELF